MLYYMISIMIPEADILTMAREAQYQADRHSGLSGYLPYTANRMRLLYRYSPLRTFLEKASTKAKEQATIQDHESHNHQGEPVGASIYNRSLRAITSDEEGRVLLGDAITIT